MASGPHAASPHHEPSGRTILPRDAVVMDFGGELGGYFSDTTRTVVVAEAPDGFEQAYAAVQEAQAAAVDAVRAGRRGAADRPRRPRDDRRRGLRRAVHPPDRPRDRPRGARASVHGGGRRRRSSSRAMTFSVEPGVYLEGRFGIRIEDIVAVTRGRGRAPEPEHAATSRSSLDRLGVDSGNPVPRGLRTPRQEPFAREVGCVKRPDHDDGHRRSSTWTSTCGVQAGRPVERRVGADPRTPAHDRRGPLPHVHDGHRDPHGRVPPRPAGHAGLVRSRGDRVPVLLGLRGALARRGLQPVPR